MEFKIGVIKGDCIGPEIVNEAIKVLNRVAEKYGHKFKYQQFLLGGASIDIYGVPLLEETLEDIAKCDAVLMGSVGADPATSVWYKLHPRKRPEAGLLALRKGLKLFVNMRPVVLYDELKESCPLKDYVIKDGFDMVVLRELTGGIYFGDRKTYIEEGVTSAYDTLIYNEHEIRRIAVKGFETAMKRNKKVTSVDKANVLDSSRLWRKIVDEVAENYPEVTLEHMLVDNCALQMVKNPGQFDVILTENMFGDILSDESSALTGSIGMLPSASMNEDNFGVYEPAHGSAPLLTGMNIANPIATILSAAMMLRYSFNLDTEAHAIENAVKEVLKEGYRTADIMTEGMNLVGTHEMGDAIVEHI